jgi:hypothetical protein
MIGRRIARIREGDEGVALVMALIFIAIVALFATVALTKNEGTSLAGQVLRDRGKLQYALDAGIERGLDRLTQEMQDPTGPHSCADAGVVTDLDPVSLNDQTVTVTCENLGGTARTSTTTISNKALVILSTAGDGLRTFGSSSASASDLASATCSDVPSGYFKITGPIYIAGPQSNSALGPPVLVCNGDAVQSATYCTDSTIQALTDIRVATATFIRDCTGQSPSEAAGTSPVLPARPAGDVDVTNCHADFNSSGLLVGVPSCSAGGSPSGVTCRVFYPGLYSAVPPTLGGSRSNYFASGTYWFQNIGLWTLADDVVVGANIDPTNDTGESKADTNCAPVTDALIAASAPILSGSPTTMLASRITGGGGTLVIDGNSQIELTDHLTVHSPLHPVSAPATTVVFGGYAAWTPAGDSEPPAGNSTCSRYYGLCNSVSSSHLNTNGRLWAPLTPFELWASAATDNLLPGGAVAYSLRLGASTSGFASSAVSTFGSVTRDAAPYRSVKLVSSTANSSIKNVVIAEISNFNGFRPRVFSWRTGLLTD